MQQRFAAGNRDHRCAQRPQLIDPAEHFLRRYGLRKIIELVAVGASQVAATDRNNVRQQRMVGRSQCMRGHARSPQVAVQSFGAAAQSCKN